MRGARYLVVTAAAVLALTGCGGTVEGTAAAPSSDPSAQSDLRPPVNATAAEPTAPVTVTVDGAAAPIDAVATDAQGALYPPTDVRRVGWWVDSALPGSGAGSVVVTGHVDDARQGTGYAERFSGLARGAEVTLTGKDGTAVRYRVTRTTSVRKGVLPTDDLNRLDGPETLILVTCGGRFIGPPMGYENNDLVYAERA
ncbi:peptidase C60 [Tsukamurella pulmonis]|uniref:Sortase family protein n=1 Tax=Tsukamurella pulmonis TaxID=47312 RepID=A0A1H1ERH8_9ACTN|nr:class F sortase [Tsukamurella pulmonis]KXO91837.1 peptidase C60 [Tsukamurella pulmonis]KXP09487.1 peptidase C60 [Tsukamurella pulmonis]RDH11866.1 class F sortase [Tsukamurella pulmonis]SDQ91343.1 Sortase family protein [Tsukamurella pulmonis]SUP20574.1 Sortase family [Tsukamurella pulmonis]